MTKTCVDVTNPKVIRSTMGSVYRMPFLYVKDVVSLREKFRERQICSYAAHLQGKNAYDEESYTGELHFYRKRGKRPDRAGCPDGRPFGKDSHVRAGGISECCYGSGHPDV